MRVVTRKGHKKVSEKTQYRWGGIRMKGAIQSRMGERKAVGSGVGPVKKVKKTGETKGQGYKKRTDPVCLPSRKRNVYAHERTNMKKK